MKQANVQIAAPGFLGVNTELAPTELDTGFCAIADNVVLAGSGRLESRKGYRILTASNTALGSAKVNVIHEARYTDGTSLNFAVGNNKIFTFDAAGVLTDITPGAATITADNWQIVTLNDDTMFFQSGHAPIVYDKSTSTCSLVTAHANYVATVPQADCAVAAYGRVWCGGVANASGTLYWSDLLIPAAWGGGSSGSLNLTNLWPNGNDTIEAIAAHNAKLIVFGRNSILVFGSSNADGQLGDPNTDIFLEDTIDRIGCVSKFGVAAVGQDLWFVDDTGVRSLGRTIQEASLPVGYISGNVKSQLRTEIKLETNKVRLVHDPDEAFTLLVLEGLPHIYCFDARGLLDDGSARTTMWTGLDFACVTRMNDGTIYFGNNDGINKYSDYKDKLDADGVDTTAEDYRMRYYFHPQTFGVPANLKLPKEADFTIAGGLLQQAVCYWGFDYKYRFKSQPFLLNADTPDFYNVDEYNITTSDDPLDPTEYNSGGGIGRYSIPLSGSGCSVILGLEVDIAGNSVAIQEINLQTKIGRMV